MTKRGLVLSYSSEIACEIEDDLANWRLVFTRVGLKQLFSGQECEDVHECSPQDIEGLVEEAFQRMMEFQNFDHAMRDAVRLGKSKELPLKLTLHLCV